MRVNASRDAHSFGDTHSFANGSDYRCRFGAAIVPTAEAPDALHRPRAGHVPATYDAEAGSLLCTSPPMAGATSAFRVTLNGQQEVASSEQNAEGRRQKVAGDVEGTWTLSTTLTLAPDPSP